MNTLKKLVMLTAVLSLGGYFAGQSSMAQLTATADIQGACSATPTPLGFGPVDPITHASGTPEQTNSISNSALATLSSQTSIFGNNWHVPPAGADVMSAGNTGHALGSGGPYTALATISPGDAIGTIAPGGSVTIFWVLQVILDIFPGFIGPVEQDITIFFTCV